MALPSCGEHFGKIFPGTYFSLPASFDYRSQQTKYSTALGRAGAMTEFARNNPMTQRLLCFIIREREHRIGQDAKDGFPIIVYVHASALSGVFRPCKKKNRMVKE